MTVTQHPPVVFAVGYSVRALVEACRRAGIECVAVDHFGDADTRHFANGRWIEFQQCERGLMTAATLAAIQSAIADITRTGAETVFLLSGGMENWGGAVEQLREMAPVLGPTEVERQKLRDLAFLNAAAQAVGMRIPQISDEAPSGDGNWLWKPRSSAGGLKIVRGKGSSIDIDAGYWQEFICGEQLGVSCIIDSSRCCILGATSSFDAADWPGPLEFIYRGSIGPIHLSIENQLQIIKLCQQLRDRIGYCGWLQFDFIRDDKDELWLLECNPRWSAGMEILLFASEVNPVREHLGTQGYQWVTPQSTESREFILFAKAIVYATHAVDISENVIARINQIEGIADRPRSPQRIESGHPVVTVRAGLKGEDASDSSEDNRAVLLDVLRKLSERVHSALCPD